MIVEIEKNKEDLNILSEEEDKNIENLQIEVNLQSEVLKSLKNSEDRIRKSLSDQQKMRENLNKSIEDIIFNKLGQPKEDNTNSYIPSSSFESMKHRLLNPVKHGIIISKFGRHPHPTLSGVFINNKGVDIQAQPNASVQAVFDGEVVGLMFISDTIGWQ
ncbi:MAG: hypothetical protein R2771_02725 [Saprospiraceae bacterium]